MEPKAILFVCTGNSCRSPMAEAMLRHFLKVRGEDNVIVDSAATLEKDGDVILAGRPASAETTNVLTANGMGHLIRGHKSKHISSVDLEMYDEIWCMGQQNLDAVLFQEPIAKAQVLMADQGGVPNPFKQGQEAYNKCYAALYPVLDEMARRLSLN